MNNLAKLLLLLLTLLLSLSFVSCNEDDTGKGEKNEGSSDNGEGVQTPPDEPEIPDESESPEEPQEPAPKPTFSVTFLSHDGVVIITNTVTEGEKVTAPSAPSRDGYDFNGWLNLETPWNFETDTVSKDLSLTPSFVVKNYSISISLEGGSFSEELTIPSVYTIESAPIEIKDPTRVGYRFDGWAINGSSAENKNYVIENGSFGDLSLVAVWSPITYTITYENLFNAQNENPTVYDVTTGAITLSSPTRKGFTFINWLLNGTVIQEIPAGTIGDIVLCAEWIEGKTPSEGLLFTPVSSGYSLAGIGTCTDTEIIIPPTYNEKPIIGIENNAFKDNDEITELFVPDSVTFIGQYAFSGCSSLKKLTVGKGVISIASCAFYNCTALTEIIFNPILCSDLTSGNEVFHRAGAEEDGIKVTFGSSVTAIPDYLFSSEQSTTCPKITSIAFEKNSACISIGSYAFAHCTYLSSVIIPESISSIERYAFAYTDALKEIDFRAISCGDLSSSDTPFLASGICGDGIVLTFGEKVISVPKNLFNSSDSSAAPNLREVKFKEGSVCQSIGSYAFYKCTALTKATLPDSVTAIKEKAFAYCSSLSEISIPESLSNLEKEAFYGCYNVDRINYNAKNFEISVTNAFYSLGNKTSGATLYIGKNVEKIPDYLFFNTSPSLAPKIIAIVFDPLCTLKEIGSFSFYECTLLSGALEIPDSVSEIGDFAFYKCGFSEINLGNSLQMLGSSAFEECLRVEEILIPDSLSSIGSGAFSGCTSLTDVTIGNGVTTIAQKVFYKCSALASVVFKDTNGWYTSTSIENTIDEAQVSDAEAMARLLTTDYASTGICKK